MKKLALFLLVSLFTFGASAQWNRLDKLKETNPERCIKVAKRYIKVFPENPASYYYISVVYFDYIDSARNLRGQYIRMGNALLYARKFEKYADSEVRERVNWDSVVVSMEDKVYELTEELSADGRFDLADHLNKKLSRLDDIASIEVVEIKKDPENLGTMNHVPVPVANKVEGEFYGLPTGTEDIESFNRTSELDLLKIINNERRRLGLEELVFEESLARACRYHAYDLGTQEYFNHNSFDRNESGKLVEVGQTFVRIRKFYDDTFVNAENLAGGNESPKDTYEQWYNSSGHYETMFDPVSRRVGIGIVHVPDSPYGYYWVLCTAE
jgi:uncharacterized protein YkwD